MGGTDEKPIYEIWCERVKVGNVTADSETEGCGLDLCRMPVFCAYGNELGGSSLTTRVTTQSLMTVH